MMLVLLCSLTMMMMTTTTMMMMMTMLGKLVLMMMTMTMLQVNIDGALGNLSDVADSFQRQVTKVDKKSRVFVQGARAIVLGPALACEAARRRWPAHCR